jgi:hypothetical protein
VINDALAFAMQLALWNTASRRARSEGLYHIEKYITTAGTTPASGIPRKNREARRPEAFFVAAIDMEMTPKVTITRGKKYFADIFFMAIFAGKINAVTAK